MTLSGFRILAAGDYPIPDTVKEAAASVNRAELFSLTKDLFRLVKALMPFADMDSISGALALAVDCGPLQLDTRMDLSDLKTASGSRLDPEKLQKLPEALGLMSMKGDLSCTKDGSAYMYRLVLDQPALQELARYSGDLTEGEASLRLENNTVVSMKVSMKGSVRALLVQLPVSVSAELIFD